MKPAQKQLDGEIKDMVAALIHRLADSQNVGKAAGGGSSRQDQEGAEDEHGVRIITLDGSNTGASLRSELELDEKPSIDEDEALAAYVNSNFQAINNSIMLSSSHSAGDPGVHVDISDHFQQHHKQGKRPKKKEGDTSKADRHSDHSA